MRMDILIIDDVVTNLAVLSDIVKGEGHLVRTARNVGEAEEAMKKKLPDLILSDISMPGTDGYEFCKRLKADSKTETIPLIFISAMNDSGSKQKGYELGAVDFISKPFDLYEVKLRINTQLRAVSAKIELGEQNRRLNKMMSDQIAMITEDQRYLIYGLVKLAEAREDPTGTHLVNVSVNAELLAQGLQLSPEYEKVISNSFIEDIGLAAPLHDIGNLAIKDRILLKEGRLTSDEMAVIKTHPEIGARTLMDMYSHNEFSRYLGMAIDSAYYHHEKWDGTGYPKGLKERNIPISARIFSIVDVYDTLTRDKCYRDAYTHEEAMEIIREETGTRFDPEIADIFFKIERGIRRN